MKRRDAVCNSLIGLFCLIVIAPLTWGAIDRGSPYEYLAGEIVPPDPTPGSDIEVRWHIKVNRYCEGSIWRRVVDVDNVVHSYDARPVARPDQIQSESILARQFTLPKQIRAGPARYSAYACYYCNPLQRALDWPICIHTPEIEFNIRAGESSG